MAQYSIKKERGCREKYRDAMPVMTQIKECRHAEKSLASFKAGIKDAVEFRIKMRGRVLHIKGELFLERGHPFRPTRLLKERRQRADRPRWGLAALPRPDDRDRPAPSERGPNLKQQFFAFDQSS